MGIVAKLIHWITTINKWVAFTTLTAMMIVVTFFSIARTVGHPIVGDVELVQFLMVLLIVGSLAYAESRNAHISIGIIIDKAPPLVRAMTDFLSYLFVIAFCFIICWVFLERMNYELSSFLLRLPFYPFKFLLIIGFGGWGLQALLKFVQFMMGQRNGLETKRH